jgi:hypothetical protein
MVKLFAVNKKKYLLKRHKDLSKAQINLKEAL